MKSTFLSVVLLLLSYLGNAQFTTVTVDGTIGSNEYGTHTDGNNQFTNGSQVWYMTWDNTNLYVALANANINEAAVLYLDKDPLTPINGGTNSNGTIAGFNYDGTSFAALQFRADLVCYFKSGYQEYRTADGAGGWSSQTSGFGSFATGTGDVRELAIPWSAIGGRPSSFAWFGYATSSGGYVYGQVPAENANAFIGTSARDNRYYIINSTADASSTKPFSRNSYVFNSTTDQTVNDLTVYDLTMNSNSKTLTKGATANWTINGNVVVNDGTVDFSTTTGSALVYTSVNVLGGTLNLNGKSLTLKSTSTQTARVAPITGTLSNATNVTVERYIPARRAWRLLTSPVTGPTLRASWMEGTNNTTVGSNSNPNPGYGTHITGTGGTTNGFDETSTNSASAKVYSSGWVNLSNTTTAIENQPGYMLFVRGDRSIDLTQGTAATPTNTVLRAAGTMKQGTQGTLNIADGVWQLVGNPYPSNIDFENFAGTTNLAQDFYVWDANRTGSYGVGSFILVTRDAPNSYSTTPIVTNGATLRYIQSGQAFFLKGQGGTASLAFAESHKTASSPTANVYRTSTSDAELMVSLNVVTGGSSLLDGLRVKYNPSFSKQVTSEDVTKMLNFGENISSYRSNTALIIERRPDVTTTNDTVFLRMTNMGVKTYSFDINLGNFAAGVTATLEDAFLNTSTPLNIAGATSVNFDVTSTTGSAATDRFRVVFRPSTALPLSFTSIKAYQAGGNKVQVDWNVASESGINNYEVERSTDGRSFTKFTTTPAKENAGKAVSYGWMDQLPVSGSNYYRVKSVAANGEQKYTAIVKVTLGKGGVEITIYPNPVKGNTFNLQLTNLEKGSYTVKLYNAAGQTVMTRTINHTGGSSSEQLTLPNAAKGVYQLEVTGENNKLSQQLIIQ